MGNISVEVYSDLYHQLITDSKGVLKKVINADAVRTSIDNIMRTSPGERVMLPTFALGLDNMLFEPINREFANQLSNNIKRAIEVWDDRVIVTAVDFAPKPDNNYVSIIVNFEIKGLTETFVHTINYNP